MIAYIIIFGLSIGGLWVACKTLERLDNIRDILEKKDDDE